MGFLPIIQGLYYILGIADTAFSWIVSSKDCDYAQPQNPPTKIDLQNGYGLLGFQTGLYYPQEVDESNWLTKVPWEMHLRRNRIKSDRQYADLREIYGGKAEKVIAAIPKNISFFLKVEYYCKIQQVKSTFPIVTTHEVYKQFTPRTFEFIGDESFEEITIEQMEVENQSNNGTFSVLRDYRIQQSNRDIQISTQHPKYFSALSPTDEMGCLTNLELSFVASLKPKPPHSLQDLVLWFDPFDIKNVHFNLNNVPGNPAHIIDYDYF